MASPFDNDVNAYGPHDSGFAGRVKPSRVLGPDGLPYRSDAPEADMAVGHPVQFACLLSSGFRSYYANRYDEAVRNSKPDALAMRNDCYLMALLQERKLATASLPYRVEVDDERDPLQKAIQEGLLRIVRRIPTFRKMVMYLLENIWYGRYGSQVKYAWEKMKLPDLRDPKKDSERKALVVRKHMPVNGDKIGFHWDATPYISVNPAYASTIKNADITPSTSGASALYLRGSWRWRYIIASHELVDADYMDAEAANAVHGVGIHSVLFWLDWLRKEWLSNIADWCERTGLGIRLWYYQGNNPQSKKEVERAARESNDRTNIFIPRFGEGKGEGVEFVDTSSAGADLLLKLQAHIEEHQERFVIGQSLSGGRGAGDSLGGEGKAKLAKDTKSQIIQYDAGNIGESLTTDLLRVIQYWTYPEPEARAVNARLVFACEEPEPEKLLNAIKTFVLDLGGKVRMQEVQALIGLGGVQEGDDVISLESIHKQQPQPPALPGAPGAPGAPPAGPGGAPKPGKPGKPSPAAGGDVSPGGRGDTSPAAGSDDYQPHGGHEEDDDDQEPGLEDIAAQQGDEGDDDQDDEEPGSVGRWQRRLSPLRYAWEPHRHPRDLKGLFTKGMESHVIGETKHVGGLPVKRHGDDSYSVKTAKGWKKGTSDKIADHIVADHAKRREEGRSRINALKRTEGWTAPHESTHPVEAAAEAAGFAKLPKDARVVSLHPDTIGRMGTVVKDKKGKNAVKLDSTGEVVTGPFEPMKKVQSWRGKGMVAGPRAKKKGAPSFVENVRSQLQILAERSSKSIEYDWQAAKPGDLTADQKSVIVARKIDRKAKAQELAEKVGGEVWMDGPRSWAVVKPEVKAPLGKLRNAESGVRQSLLAQAAGILGKMPKVHAAFEKNVGKLNIDRQWLSDGLDDQTPEEIWVELTGDDGLTSEVFTTADAFHHGLVYGIGESALARYDPAGEEDTDFEDAIGEYVHSQLKKIVLERKDEIMGALNKLDTPRQQKRRADRKEYKQGEPRRYQADAALRRAIKLAAVETDTSPTEDQRKAGNYKKGHVTLQGLDISIENPAGSRRRPEWAPLANHYGYIRRAWSDADGDAIDVFIGPDPESDVVFVVDQVDGDWQFDEHKVMLGFLDKADAKAAYLANYSPNWHGFGGITPLTMAEFKEWIAEGDTSGAVG